MENNNNNNNIITPAVRRPSAAAELEFYGRQEPLVFISSVGAAATAAFTSGFSRNKRPEAKEKEVSRNHVPLPSLRY